MQLTGKRVGWAIFRRGPRTTHVVLAGDLVPTGTMLVTPGLLTTDETSDSFAKSSTPNAACSPETTVNMNRGHSKRGKKAWDRVHWWQSFLPTQAQPKNTSGQSLCTIRRNSSTNPHQNRFVFTRPSRHWLPTGKWLDWWRSHANTFTVFMHTCARNEPECGYRNAVSTDEFVAEPAAFSMKSAWQRTCIMCAYACS